MKQNKRKASVKKILSVLLLLSIIFSLSACGFDEIKQNVESFAQDAQDIVGDVREKADSFGDDVQGVIDDIKGNSSNSESSTLPTNSPAVQSNNKLSDSLGKDGVKSNTTASTPLPATDLSLFSIDSIPAFSGQAYISVNGNTPYFANSDLVTTSYEYYSPLDALGRCGVTVACIGKDIMPTEARGTIGQVKPSGWHTVKYDIVDGKYLYNRCHLIGYQLTGENANVCNLITGTRQLNISVMVPFENMVADYIAETGNHVLYRSTPIFMGDDMVATGVLLEAESVEDNGDGILFNVFCYNVQDGISIDYSNGDSFLATEPAEPVITRETPEENSQEVQKNGTTYILNTNTKKFHYPSCSSVGQMKDSNKREFTGDRSEIISQGYDPCKKCNP